MKKSVAVAMLLAALVPACQGESVSEPEVTTVAASPASRAPGAPSSAVRGFRHTADRSRFSLGAIRSEVREHGLRRTVGTEGVFAVHEATGDSIAIPDADAPSTRVPCRMSAEEHNRAVTGYFLAAGLPREQMTAAGVTTLHQGTGPIDELGVTSEDHGFMAYYSHVGRAIDGIVVVESTAWARLNDEGVVVSEEVRWPELPTSVVADAAALRALLEDPTALRALHAKIGLDLPGRVTIHHPTWSSGPSFAPFASYDVMDAPDGLLDSSAHVRHFRRDGSEIEIPTAPAAAESRR